MSNQKQIDMATYDFFFEMNGETFGLREGESFMTVYDIDTKTCVGVITGHLKDYKTSTDGATVDLSNIDYDKLIGGIRYC